MIHNGNGEAQGAQGANNGELDAVELTAWDEELAAKDAAADAQEMVGVFYKDAKTLAEARELADADKRDLAAEAAAAGMDERAYIAREAARLGISEVALIVRANPTAWSPGVKSKLTLEREAAEAAAAEGRRRVNGILYPTETPKLDKEAETARRGRGRPRTDNPSDKTLANRRSEERRDAIAIGESLDMRHRIDELEAADTARILHYMGADLALVDSRGGALHYCDQRGIWQPVSVSWSDEGWREFVGNAIGAARTAALRELVESPELIADADEREHYSQAFAAMRQPSHAYKREVGLNLTTIGAQGGIGRISAQSEHDYRLAPVIPMADGGWDVVNGETIDRTALRAMNIIGVNWRMDAPDLEAWRNPRTDAERRVADILANHYGGEYLDRMALGLLGPDKRIESVKADMQNFGKSTAWTALAKAFTGMVATPGQKALANIGGRFTPIHSALANALWVVIDEAQAADGVNTGQINELISETLAVERKGIDAYEARRRGTLWFVGNDWARLDTTSPGMESRLEWAYDFSLRPDGMAAMSDADGRLMQTAAAARVLQAYMLIRAQAMAADNGWGEDWDTPLSRAKRETTSGTADESRAALMAAGTPVAILALQDAFMPATTAETGFVSAAEVDAAFERFGIEKKSRPKTKTLSAYMARISNGAAKPTRKTIDGVQVRGWSGLKALSEAEADN